MKDKNTGIMLSFTLGAAAGLYATSQKVRHKIQNFRAPQQRDIFEGEGESQIIPQRSHAGLKRIQHMFKKDQKKW